MRQNRYLILATLALTLVFLADACSSKPFLKIQYQLPFTSQALDGKRVSLKITDMRANHTFLSENAKKSLKGFKETFSLVVLRPDGSGNLVGAYDLFSMLTEIFKQRLENTGLQVFKAAEDFDSKLEIQIKNLHLDLAGRKWIVSMNYQANLIKDGNILSRESVNGTAERLKVIGKSDAEKILGELLTDMANKLDPMKLFQ